MRRDITFESKGLRCAGWLYVPDDLKQGQRAPTIVMAHGFSAVKEQNLDDYAERFAKAGFVTLVFDYRYLGTSEGEPRGQIFWYQQHEDYRNAITWVSDQPEADPLRIGLWGTSYSGAHVLYLGAHEIRIKAVVSQVHGGINTWDALEIILKKEGIALIKDMINQDRIARYKTGKINYLPVTGPEGEEAFMPGNEAYEWFTRSDAPNWLNQVTMESVEKFIEYDPGAWIHRISPTPLLMILAEKDTVIRLDMAKKVYERAGEPKDLIVLPCKHFDVYDKEPYFSQAADAAIQWFKKYL